MEIKNGSLGAAGKTAVSGPLRCRDSQQEKIGHRKKIRINADLVVGTGARNMLH
jgi:hypothetical protein